MKGIEAAPQPMSDREIIKDTLISMWAKGYGKTPNYLKAIEILDNPGKWFHTPNLNTRKQPMSVLGLLDSAGANLNEKYKDGEQYLKLLPGMHNLIGK